MMSTVDLLQDSLSTGIKHHQHLHIVLKALNYALKDFDDEHC